MSAQPVDVLAAARISFTPCTGFGDEGRAATLFDATGEVIGTGYGATDDEAVVEALMDAGMTFDAAFDARAAVMAAAEPPHADDEPGYVEFPHGEFPPQANVGPLA